MEKLDDQDAGLKFFAAELRNDLPELDLHSSFESGQIEIVLDQFLCQQIRKEEGAAAIIYGGGKGVLRNIVLKALEKHPLVIGVKDQGGYCLAILGKVDI